MHFLVSYIYGSGTDTILLFILFYLLEILFQKGQGSVVFKSDLDEIWHICSTSSYAAIDVIL